jgi:hypothetical protein
MALDWIKNSDKKMVFSPQRECEFWPKFNSKIAQK